MCVSHGQNGESQAFLLPFKLGRSMFNFAFLGYSVAIIVKGKRNLTFHQVPFEVKHSTIFQHWPNVIPEKQ
jgi:hypothetical protein